MYLCAVTGIASLLLFVVGIYRQQWYFSCILLLIAVRQAVVFPKWKKKLNQEKRDRQ